MLGFHFSGKPNVGEHVKVLRRRFGQRLWILRHLRTAGFNDEELVKVYRTVIRPVADYMAVVYHPMLSDEQDEQLERMQAQALKSIFGWEHSYAALRSRAKIPTLRQRREDMVDKFAATCAASPVFKRWFPRRERTRQASRTSEVYVETFARCDRLRNSPVHYMRRRLNGKVGRPHGSRNREYRDTLGDGITLTSGLASVRRRGY